MARLQSVDALRGLTVAAMLVVNDAGDWSHVNRWFEHATWHGLMPADLIFPLFLFIVGVSIQLALAPQLERGVAPSQLTHKLLWRALRLVLLGLALHALATWWLGRPMRPCGVLQRIGLCYAAAGLVAVHWGSARRQWLLFAAMLLLYGALLLSAPLTLGDTLGDRLDTALFGSHVYVFDAVSGKGHDPEGLLSTLPCIASVLLGLRAGDALRRGALRVLWLLAAATLLAGLLLAPLLPLNKNLWSPSFVLVTGGISCALLALAHALVDERGWPALGRSMGINAISAYALAWVAAVALDASGLMAPLYKHLFSAPLTPPFEPWVASAAYALVFTALVWALMALAARRGWRVTI